MFTTLQNFNSLIDGACGVFRDALIGQLPTAIVFIIVLEALFITLTVFDTEFVTYTLLSSGLTIIPYGPG